MLLSIDKIANFELKTMASTQEQRTSQIPDVPETFETIKTNDKLDEDFRVYSEETSEKRVVEHYRDMRKFQTVNFYRKMEEKYSFEEGSCRKMMTIEEAFAELENYVVSEEKLSSLDFHQSVGGELSFLYLCCSGELLI